MNSEMFQPMQEQFQKNVVEPMQAFTSLGVNQVEQLMGAQLDAVKTYTDLGIKQTRAALEINNPQDLQDYIKNQGEFVNTLSKQLQNDAQKMVNLGKDFTEQAQKLAQEKVGSFAAK